MHGTVLSQSQAHRRRSSSQHMPSAKITTDRFLKDGRTISVGDCALFEPPWESPPFIGIIRQLSYSEENHLQLRVNWLYRPAELKLGKGILLDAAPNEVFYSFHNDDSPAASLLHPCRVAFLPKDVELPSGIASFVCRRVYDIENKCLWWLTDQDYIDERQEEVDQLLQKTRIEMQATVQTSGRSPKPIDRTSTSQLKPGSDCVENMTSFTSHIKGKKRERGDQCSEPMKRERSTKTDDGGSSQSKRVSNLKSEIAILTDKGGLVDSEGVERLVHLMQPDKAENKMDLICRSMLAGVIASTDTFDCLNKFVQLRGLALLDKWLQDFHKGKIGDRSSSKDGGKSVEEFLLVLLCALDKLPVNLQALQMCNIGRSVNNLRSHKNLEIQKKSRSLVDTWKKRVEAEMNSIDSKSGSNQTVPSWSSKSASHGGNVNSVGSGDISTKSSITQFPACKTSSSKSSPKGIPRSVSSPPGVVKSVSSPASVKESQPRTTVGSASDVTSTTREDKSSSSSQFQDQSKSLLVKEDSKSPTGGSVSVLNKVSTGESQHRKLIDGFSGASVSGSQKETGSSRSFSLQRSSTLEKLPHSGLTGEKVLDATVVEGSSHKLIVKIPNRGRSHAQSANGGSLEDYSILSSRASSPVLVNDHDQFERNPKDRSDASRGNNLLVVNTESCQSNTDPKDVQTGPDDCNGSPAALPAEERSRNAEDIRKAGEVSKVVFASSGNKLKSRKLHDAPFCSMNALVESCVKYSEANPSISVGDDVGMNLLASVATREISKSELVSPTDSPQKSSSAAEDACMDNQARSKPLSANNLVQDGDKLNDEGDGDDKKHLLLATTSWTQDGLTQAIHASVELCGDKDTVSSSSEENRAGVTVKCFNSACADMQIALDSCLEIDEKLDEMKGFTSLSPTSMAEKAREGEISRPHEEKADASCSVGADRVSDAKLGGSGSSVSEVKVILDVDDVKQKVEVSSLNHSENENEDDVIKGSATVRHVTLRSPSIVADGEMLPPHISGEDLVLDNVNEHKVKVRGAEEKGPGELDNEKQRHVKDTSMFPRDSAVTDQTRDSIESNDETKKLLEINPSKLHQKESSASYTSEDVQKHIGVAESKLPGFEAQVEERTHTMAEASSSCPAEAPDSDPKMKFDLNEGLTADDGKYGEQIMMTTSVCPSNVQSINSLPSAASLVSSSLPASITVAAAAKGPFVPPEDLLRSKGELGWKGSAATSAFRPAEPRKVFQASLASTTIPPPDAFTSKSGRAPLDFDLNVPDERILEDLACRDSDAEICSSSNFSSNEPTVSAPRHSKGGLDLDLNRTDDANDMGQQSASSIHRPEPPISLPSGVIGMLTNEVRRGFDLNSGPSVDDATAGQPSYTQHPMGSIHSRIPIAGLRPNNAEIGNFSSWFPPGNTYPTMSNPSILHDRTGAPPRIFGPAGSTPFIPEVFRNSVLSSSPAVPFPSTPFQYPVYPFGTTFPLPSTTFAIGSTPYINASSGGVIFTPPVNSQSRGPVDTVSSQYPRPYVVSLPEGNSVSSGESNRKWGRQGLDLNAGPGTLNVEGREERFLMASNQQSVASLQSLPGEQARIYAVGGGDLKRKEPDGSRDYESLRYKQSSWQ